MFSGIPARCAILPVRCVHNRPPKPPDPAYGGGIVPDQTVESRPENVEDHLQ